MRLVQPPGDRSCRSGGSWEHCRAPTGRNHWILDLEELLASASEIHDRLLRAELLDLMRRAERGDLVFGRHADVNQMEVELTVLELRLVSRPGDEDDDQIVRLYFTEPEEIDECLLALRLAGKRPGPLISEEQNRHAHQAAFRAHEFFEARG